MGFYDDDSALEFVRNKAPEYLQAYMAITEPVVRADFFRYIVLYVEGGLYTDIDTECITPLENYAVKTDGALVVGLEAEFGSSLEAQIRSYAREIQILQWTIMAKQPGHPILKAACDTIAKYALVEGLLSSFSEIYGHDRAILEFSGPGLWTDVVFSDLARDDKGLCSNCSVTILPQVAWGTLHAHRSNDVHVVHHFHGSWKEDWLRHLNTNVTDSNHTNVTSSPTLSPTEQPTTSPTSSPSSSDSCDGSDSWWCRYRVIRLWYQRLRRWWRWLRLRS